MSHRCDSTNSPSATCCYTQWHVRHVSCSGFDSVESSTVTDSCRYLFSRIVFFFFFLLFPVWMHWQGCCLIALCNNNKGIVMLKCLDLYGMNRNTYTAWSSSVCSTDFSRWIAEYREVMEAIAKPIKTSLVPELQLVTYTQWLNHFPRSG